MGRIGNQFFLFLGVGSPEDENHGCFTLVEKLNYPVGEKFPAFVPVGVRLAVTDSECGIEKEYSLLGPVCQITVVRRRDLLRIFFRKIRLPAPPAMKPRLCISVGSSSRPQP